MRSIQKKFLMLWMNPYIVIVSWCENHHLPLPYSARITSDHGTAALRRTFQKRLNIFRQMRKLIMFITCCKIHHTICNRVIWI